ncbi:magnesium/cobalt transporter CorA [Pontibacter akesuensis]|uniref:Magnesium transport protein CorA n=1 Tax=Pontibacter akesuensis TaxID=388950 RepID=A0A1I7J7N7_9BACT|nr:magnesium/cobalt transporter CorA [Pontibacter akesuensis]GHA71932.1 magnesium transport protein CorA [Pontibacter akesuensis]SFU81132.1 magnesium transporter [Pontibacter akesuensis]
MAKRKHNRSRDKILQRKAGVKPGSLFIPFEAFAPRFFLMSFSEDFFEELEVKTYPELVQRVTSRPDARHWIDIRGYRDEKMLEQLAVDFNLHPLQMEDVVNDYQRPKVEQFDKNRLFIISRMLRWSTENKTLEDVQLSLFTGPNYVLSLQSDYEDCLDPLRERIRVGKGVIRKRPTIYMAYAMMDVVLDYYFPVIADMGDYIEDMEQQVLLQPSRNNLALILDLKSELVKLRRIVWPERDKMTELLRMDEEVIHESLKAYFRDAYDHTIQLIDLIDNHKEMASSLVDLHMSTVSNRMNEIMKVLTIISSIFIPLSFIVGLYGMNFSREDPETGRVLPYNMPELYEPYAYPILVSLMGLLIVSQLIFFYRKGWFRSF